MEAWAPTYGSDMSERALKANHSYLRRINRAEFGRRRSCAGQEESCGTLSQVRAPFRALSIVCAIRTQGCTQACHSLLLQGGNGHL